MKVVVAVRNLALRHIHCYMELEVVGCLEERRFQLSCMQRMVVQEACQFGEYFGFRRVLRKGLVVGRF